MKGDFSKRSFNSKKHYSSVRMQQGRVQLDADWNEQMDIFDYRQQTELADFLGTSGAPANNPGFEVFPNPNDITRLNIGTGRYYIAGILCELESPAAGITAIDYEAQPDYEGAQLPPEDGYYLAYLDAWQRHVTSLEDPDLREVALGGADTSTRLQNIAQVKLLPVTADATPSITDTFQEWGNLINRVPITLTPSPSSGAQLQNQLYRIEIHKGGTTAEATYKWSRENGSIVLQIQYILLDSDGVADIQVNDANPSLINQFVVGDWIELNSAEREFARQPGYFGFIKEISGTTFTIAWDENETPPNDLIYPEIYINRFIRRWESNAIPISPGLHGLENGLLVTFSSSGECRTGDYWMIPARANTSSIEWPKNAGGFIAQGPHGIQHYYAQLALLKHSNGVWASLGDMRNIFPNLEMVETPDTRVLAPVSDLNALRAVNTTQLLNGVLIQCSALGLYRFDKNSTTDDGVDDNVVRPNTGPGRFVRIAALDARSKLLAPVDTVASIQSIDTSELPNGTLVYCHDRGLYALSKNNLITADNYEIIQPVNALDRFIRISSSSVSFKPFDFGEGGAALSPEHNGNIVNFKDYTSRNLNLPLANSYPDGFHVIINNVGTTRSASLGLVVPMGNTLSGPSIIYRGEHALLFNEHLTNTWYCLKSSATGRQAWPLSLGSFYPASSNGANVTQVGGGGHSDIRGFAFPHTLRTSVHTLIHFPSSLQTSDIGISLHWTHTKQLSYGPNVIWRVHALWHNHGERMTYRTFPDGTPDSGITISSTAPFVNNGLTVTSEQIITIQGTVPSPNDSSNSRLLELKISREPDPDLDVPAILVGVTLYVNKIKMTDD